jgi:hypothetical protein
MFDTLFFVSAIFEAIVSLTHDDCKSDHSLLDPEMMPQVDMMNSMLQTWIGHAVCSNGDLNSSDACVQISVNFHK